MIPYSYFFFLLISISYFCHFSYFRISSFSLSVFSRLFSSNLFFFLILFVSRIAHRTHSYWYVWAGNVPTYSRTCS